MENRDQILIAVGRLEGKVDSLLHNQNRTEKDLDEHDARLSKLERSRAWLVGAGAATGALLSFIFHRILP